LPMAELRSDLQSLKLRNVRTYIQSGNVVFDSTAKGASSLAKRIGARIEERHGFRPHLVLLDREELLAAVESNPFPRAVTDPKTLHFFFLADPADSPDMKTLNDAKAPTEDYRITDRVFYLWAPDGIGHSKLAANAERHLGVAATARNFRTVLRLVEMTTQT